MQYEGSCLFGTTIAIAAQAQLAGIAFLISIAGFLQKDCMA